jgi:hypothetical protein
MAMHQDFADWYRRVHIDPNADELEKRWVGIESFHEKATTSDLCDAARVFFGLTPKDDAFLSKYREEFKAADSAFPMRDNGAELQVLAGATLANHFSNRNTLAIVTALSLSCGACEGRRKAPVPEIVDLARRTLRNQSSSLRVSRQQVVLPSLDVDETLKQLETVLNDPAVSLQTLKEPLFEALEALSKTVLSVAKWAKRAGLIEDLRQEESDILWWLFGEHSRDLDLAFAELKSPAGCLVGAKEIADLTRVPPGPIGVEAYLRKMLKLAHPDLTGEVALSDAVQACPSEWEKQFAAMQGLESVADLCPIHLAAQKSVEAGGKTSVWHVAFKTVSGLNAAVKLKPIDLALQAYRERLFVCALSELEGSTHG